MNTRARHEKSIRRADPWLGEKFENALTLIAFQRGLEWLTDEQVADLRNFMIRHDWRRNRNSMASRKLYAQRAALSEGA